MSRQTSEDDTEQCIITNICLEAGSTVRDVVESTQKSEKSWKKMTSLVPDPDSMGHNSRSFSVHVLLGDLKLVALLLLD